MDNDLKKEFLFVAAVCVIAVLAGIAGYFCMTPEQRAAARENKEWKLNSQNITKMKVFFHQQ